MVCFYVCHAGFFPRAHPTSDNQVSDKSEEELSQELSQEFDDIDWNDPTILLGLSLSYLNISPSDFWDLSPRELHDSFYFSSKKRSDDFDLYYREYMNGMRLQTLFLINIQLEYKNRIKTPEALMQFPWDKNIIKVEPTPFYDDEAEYYEAKMRKFSTVINHPRDLLELQSKS